MKTNITMPKWIEDMRRLAKEQKLKVLAKDRPIFEAALEYHQQGLWPIPVHPDKKQPLILWAEFQARQPTVEELYRWWAEFPNARIGLVTGAGPDLVAIDLDPRNGGKPEDVEVPAGAPRVCTPRKGLHHYCRHPGHQVPNRVGIRPGVDIRGDGGFVIAPPSPGYVWEVPLDGHPLPMVPAWVLEEDRQKESGKARGDDWFSRTYAEATPKGQRNDTATRLAGYLLHKEVSPEVTTEILRPWASRCVPPFPQEELAGVVASIWKREADKNRRPALCLQAPSTLVAPELRFTIDSLVPAGTLTLLIGKDKIGKTLFAMEMIRAVRSGTPFLGQFPAAQGEVIALFLDDPTGLVRERLVERLGLSDDGLAVATHLDADTDHPPRLLDALANEAAARRPALIIVDALYVLLKGREQLQQAGEMVPLMRRLDRIAEESGAAVVLIHHPRKSDEEAAGSFVIRASAKSILTLSRPRDQDDGGGDPNTGRRLLHVEGKFLPEASYALGFGGPGQWRLLGEAGQVRMEDLGAAVEAEVSRQPGLTADDLAGSLSRRPEYVRGALKELVKKGRVHLRKTRTKRKGRRKNTWWPGSGSDEGS